MTPADAPRCVVREWDGALHLRCCNVATVGRRCEHHAPACHKNVTPWCGCGRPGCMPAPAPVVTVTDVRHRWVTEGDPDDGEVRCSHCDARPGGKWAALPCGS